MDDGPRIAGLAIVLTAVTATGGYDAYLAARDGVIRVLIPAAIAFAVAGCALVWLAGYTRRRHREEAEAERAEQERLARGHGSEGSMPADPFVVDERPRRFGR
jgi:hypothetical protein